MSNKVRLAGESINGSCVVYEIVSTRLVTDLNDKHVLYMVQVRHTSGKEDVNPISIERRYTHFHTLYTGLKQDFSDLMLNVSFPKKVLTGNFDEKLICSRCKEFESLLKHISSESRLTYSKYMNEFLQGVELQAAKELVKEKKMDQAIPLLENSFRILNKVYTDRWKAVLLALCRILACRASLPGAPGLQDWTKLALYRYEGVSDSDLLSLYVPLLKLCLRHASTEDEKNVLNSRLMDLKRQGMKIHDAPELLDAVALIEHI